MKDLQRLLKMEKSKLGILLTVFMFGFVILTSQVFAVAPHPDAVEEWKKEGVLEEKLANLRAFKEAGGNSAEIHTPISKDRDGSSLALGTDKVDTSYTVVILVDFSDKPMSAGVPTQPYQFDSVLFSDNYYNPTGSMTDYYKENSYGNFVLKGDIFGPYRMPQTYTYYEGGNNGMSYSSLLVQTALDSVRNYVAHWLKYDSNNDVYCDGLVVIHAGPGGETGSGIWSHKSNISPVTIDGVIISAYTMNPEENGSGEISSIGVFCHEYGHIMGLPDLYDISGTANSMGLGNWAIMATGSYNGGSRTPSHFTAWSKAEMGFLTLLEVDNNMTQVEFPHVEENPVAYKLCNSLSNVYEYWIVENRQQVGFDVGLPSSGLCIYHVDKHAVFEYGSSNYDPDWYRVALEQADGKNSLAYDGSRGDAGDVWPGNSNAREFHDLTVPNTHTNLLGPFTNDETTRIGLWNISNSGLTMTADLDEDWSRPWPLLANHDSVLFDDSQPGGDGDGILDPGETISFYCTMKNLMRLSYNATIRLETDNPSVTFNTDQVLLSPQFNSSDQINLTPITFTLSSSFVPTIDSFFLIVECDSIAGIPYDSWTSKTFGLEVNLGPPQVLIVDDDRGKSYEDVYTNAMYNEKVPYAVWTKASKSSPTGDELKKYPMVFWFTGDSSGNVFTAADVAAMKEYLDAGGDLLISSISGAQSLNDLDSVFLQDYLGVYCSGGSIMYPFFNGVAGSQFGDGTKYRYDATIPEYNKMVYFDSVANGAEAALVLSSKTYVCGVTKQTMYNSIFVTFPIEYLGDQFSNYNTKADFFARVLDFFGGIPLGVDDNSPSLALPMNFDLSQNYPNPFNPSTTISYTLRPVEGKLPVTTLSIYNLLGRRVATLVDKIQLPGTYDIEWDGATQAGQQVASGVYFYKLSRGSDSQSKKMILLK